MIDHKAFTRFGIEYYLNGNLEGTHFVDTITEAIDFARARKEIGLYNQTRFITADQYGNKIDYIDKPDFQETKKRQERKERIAARLDELIDPWEKEEDHLEEVLETLEADPLAIIEELLARIEDLEA